MLEAEFHCRDALLNYLIEIIGEIVEGQITKARRCQKSGMVKPGWPAVDRLSATDSAVRERRANCILGVIARRANGESIGHARSISPTIP